MPSRTVYRRRPIRRPPVHSWRSAIPPISATLLGSHFSSLDATSYSTAAYTPTADRFLVAVFSSGLAGTIADPTSVTGNGLTWDKVIRQDWDVSGTRQSSWLYVAKSGSSPTNTAFTVTFAATMTSVEMIVAEFNGCDLSLSALDIVKQTNTSTGNSTSGSVTLSALSNSNNASLGYVVHQANETTTVGSGYTDVHQGSHAGPSQSALLEMLAPGSTTVDASWVTSALYGIIGAELASARPGGGAAPIQGLATFVVSAHALATSDKIGLSSSRSIVPVAERITNAKVGLSSSSAAVPVVERITALKVAASSSNASVPVVERITSLKIGASSAVALTTLVERVTPLKIGVSSVSGAVPVYDRITNLKIASGSAGNLPVIYAVATGFAGISYHAFFTVPVSLSASGVKLAASSARALVPAHERVTALKLGSSSARALVPAVERVTLAKTAQGSLSALVSASASAGALKLAQGSVLTLEPVWWLASGSALAGTARYATVLAPIVARAAGVKVALELARAGVGVIARASSSKIASSSVRYYIVTFGTQQVLVTEFRIRGLPFFSTLTTIEPITSSGISLLPWDSL